MFLVNWWPVVILIALLVAFLVFAIWRIVEAHQRQATTGTEDLKGKTVIVRETIDPEGTVMFEGETWIAISNSGKIESGEEVIITKVKGLKLLVAKKAKE